MTQKHFIAIAKILAGDWACATAAEKLVIWKTTLSLADYFASENERFDREKFYTAVFGTPNHFAVRDLAYAEVMRQKETGLPGRVDVSRLGHAAARAVREGR